MKSIAPWFCLITALGSANAADGLEAYRLGNYFVAARELPKYSDKDSTARYYLGMMRLYGYGELKNNTLALKYFTEAAAAGYLPAQQLLAVYYLNAGNDPTKALEYFKKAAAADDLSAQMYCAAAYKFGYGAKKNSDTARRYFISAAKSGNAIAQTALAEQFLESRDKRNKRMGLIWLNKAVDKNNPRALTVMAELYSSGNFVSKDSDKTKSFLTQAITQNYAPAMVQMAEIEFKEGKASDALNLLNKAATLNDSNAQLALGNYYLNVKNSGYNRETGLEWLLKSTEQGNHDAQVSLAKLDNEGNNTPQEAKLAARIQQALHKKINDKPTVAMAQWLSNNKSRDFSAKEYQLNGIYSAWQNPTALIENNYNPAPEISTLNRQAIYKPQFTMAKPAEIPINEYFDILAPTLNGGQNNNWTFPRYPLYKHMEALLQNDALIFSVDGKKVGIKKIIKQSDDEQAPFDYIAEKTNDWSRQANYQTVLTELYGKAILGDSSAQFELGQLYQYGVAVTQNSNQAITYFQLAAEQQDIRAEYNLGILYLEGKTNPVDFKKGVEWLTDAAFKGNAYAQYVLGNVYEKGLTDRNHEVIVPIDHQKAMGMYYLSASNHFGDAQYRLADFLVKEKNGNLSISAHENRNKLIKRLYHGAAEEGVLEAKLPLAFYQAMDRDPEKQQQAFATAKNAANAGNPEAAILVGLMLERGLGVNKDSSEALQWYRKAEKNPITDFILGTYYSQGVGLNKNTSLGQRLLQSAADANFSYANLNLAVLEQQNGSDFLAELDKARQLGNSKAGLLLADYYLQTANNPEKMQQARDIYNYFAEKGDKDAQLKLAFLYDRGLAGPNNSEEAAHWYGQAAEQGQPVAQYLLATMYQLGRIDKEPNYKAAKKWLSEASSTYPPAALALGFIEDTVDNNYKKAADLYSIAASDSTSLYNLGLIHELGKGTAVNTVLAQELYQKAADLGSSKAMNQLAGLYLNGANGARDPEKALIWYKKSAELGDRNALYQLGLLAETGVASPLDLKKALQYYQASASSGNEKASLAIARMYQYGLGVEKNYNQAADIYKKLAANHNGFAQYQLGLLYASDKLGNPQLNESRALLKKASDNGNSEAFSKMQWLDAHQGQSLSFIATVPLSSARIRIGEESANILYLIALNEWNRGDEHHSRLLLSDIVAKYPNFTPARRAVELLTHNEKVLVSRK